MAACLSACDIKKFNAQEIGKFADRMQNVLEVSEARNIFKQYLENVHRPDMLKVLNLWQDADWYLKLSENYDEDTMMDQIDEIDDFNTNPFLSISESNHKLLYIKEECARILTKMLKVFVKYLEQHHKQ